MLDVIDRFEPGLAPFTRCPDCNGVLRPVAKAAIAGLLKPGTARSYLEFAQCLHCAQVYWRGAHSDKLDALISAAGDVVRRGIKQGVTRHDLWVEEGHVADDGNGPVWSHPSGSVQH